MTSALFGSANGSAVTLSWRELPEIPPNTRAWHDAIPVAENYWRQLGLAGPVVGVQGDYLLVGGGANFPEPGGMPHEPNLLGKVYWDEVFVMDLKTETWLDTRLRLPLALAYAATVSLADGVLVIGGEGCRGGPRGAKQDGIRTFAETFLVKFDPRHGVLDLVPYPPLPAVSSSGVAAHLGSTVYYCDGTALLALALDRLRDGWTKVSAVPGGPRTAMVGGAAGNCFFLASGRTQQRDGRWTIRDDAFVFEPSSGTWRCLPALPAAAMAGLCFGLGNGRLMIVGGDSNAARFDLLTGLDAARAAADSSSREWHRINTALQFAADHHTGFNTEILVLDIESPAWSLAGHFPGSAPVMTQPVLWRGRPLVVSGEVRPGVRSPKVWMGNVGCRAA